MDTKKKLSPEAYHITQECGTEPPFSGEYYNHDETGDYHCICCDSLYLNQAQSLTLGVVGQVSMKLLIVIVFVR